MSAHVHQAKVVFRNGVPFHLAEMSYVFVCPAEGCEYVMTARTEDEIDVIEDTHYKIAPSTHVEFLKDKNWQESPLSDSTGNEYVVENPAHARYAHAKGWRS